MCLIMVSKNFRFMKHPKIDVDNFDLFLTQNGHPGRVPAFGCVRTKTALALFVGKGFASFLPHAAFALARPYSRTTSLLS